jgi:pilus assembly protein CpaC
MFQLIKEDNSRRIGRMATALLVVFATAVGPSALAQDEKNAEDFSAKVLDLAEHMQHVTVPLYGSLTIETTHEVIRADVVATAIADVQVVSPTLLLITGQSYGHTTVILLREDKRQYVFEVSVELDLGRLNEAIAEIDPQSNAKARSVLGNIVITGTVSSAERATRVVELASLFLPGNTSTKQSAVVQNHMDVAGEQQVLLRVVVAEVNRIAVRELGVNGFLAGDNFKDGFLVNQIGGINPINIGAAGDVDVTGRIPFLTGENGIPLSPQSTLSLGFPRVQMQLFIRALADNSLLKVLAEPNLVAISGETATFLAGGEFPVPVPQGFQTVTIEYREFGVRLNFTPVVRGHDRIRLRVNPEISELDFGSGVQLEGLVIPGLRSRSTETTVELGSGETIAIAGLLSEQVSGFVSRVPGIGDVPILGVMFRSIKYQRQLSELIILVTPEIVAPLDAHQKIKLPGQDFTDPSDHELYLLGMLEGAHANSDGVAGVGGSSAMLASQPEQMSVHGPWGHAGSNGAR